MPESLIRENLNELEKYIAYYNREEVLDVKKYYANKLVEMLFPFKTVADKLTEEEMERIREIISKSERIIKLTFPRVHPDDQKDYLSEKLEALEELKNATRKITKKELKDDEELQKRREELREELKSRVRVEDGVYLKRDVFDVIRSISSVRLYKDEKPDQISTKNMVLSSEDVTRLMYLREMLTKDLKAFAEEIYFEKSPDYKKIIEGRKQGLKTSQVSDLVEYLENLEELNKDSFAQVTMNDEELELLKEKLKSLTLKKLKTEWNTLPENVKRIAEEFKRTMEKESYDELVRDSLLVDTYKIETFSKERLTSAELKQLKAVLKYQYREKIEKAKKQNTQSKQDPTKKAKLDNFKYHWLNYHKRANKEEKLEHIKLLENLNQSSIYGIELTEKELKELKAELIREGSKGIELTEQEINGITETITSPSNVKDKKQEITKYIQTKIAEILGLPEEKRKNAIENLDIQKDTIPGIELTVEEIAKMKENIKRFTTTPKSKEEIIAEFINEKINELLRLPEDKREKVFDNLKITKNTIPGVVLNDEEIKQILDEIYSKTIANTYKKMFEAMSKLFLKEKAKIGKMTHQEIKERYEKAKQMSYEEFLKEEKGFQLTPEEFAIYHKLWLEELKEANINHYAKEMIENKINKLSLEELQNYQLDRNELKGLAESEIPKLESIIQKEIKKLIKAKKEDLNKLENLYPEKSKIKFTRNGKMVNGKIKGYQLTKPGSPDKICYSKKEVQEFLKNNPDYSFEKYLISSFKHENELVEKREVTKRTKKFPWSKEKDEELRKETIPSLINKKRKELAKKLFKKEQKEQLIKEEPLKQEDYLKAINLLNEKVDLSSHGLEKAYFSGIHFKDQIITEKETALTLLAEGKIPTGLKILVPTTQGKILNFTATDLVTIIPKMRKDEKPLLHQTIEKCRDLENYLEIDLSEKYENITKIVGIAFEDGKIYRNRAEVEEALEKQLHPVQVVTKEKQPDMGEPIFKSENFLTFKLVSKQQTQSNNASFTKDQLEKYQTIKTYMNKELEMSNNPNQKLNLFEIIMEDGSHCTVPDTYEFILNQGNKPLQVVLKNKDTEELLEVEVNEFLEKVKVSSPVNNKYQNAANLFEKKLNLNALGKNYGYLRCMNFPNCETAFNTEEARDLLNQNKTPESFTICCPQGNELIDLNISGAEIDKLLSLPIINLNIPQMPQFADDLNKIGENLEQDNDFDLGIDKIFMEDSEVVQKKEEYNKKVTNGIMPFAILLNSGMELRTPQYLEKLKQYQMGEEDLSVNTDTNPKLSVSEKDGNYIDDPTNMSPEEIAQRINMKPETWALLSDEHKKVIIEEYLSTFNNRSR